MLMLSELGCLQIYNKKVDERSSQLNTKIQAVAKLVSRSSLQNVPSTNNQQETSVREEALGQSVADEDWYSARDDWNGSWDIENNLPRSRRLSYETFPKTCRSPSSLCGFTEKREKNVETCAPDTGIPKNFDSKFFMNLRSRFKGLKASVLQDKEKV